MSESGDVDLRGMVEILLERGRREFLAALADPAGADAGPAPGGISGALADRGLLLAAWAEALERHCDRALHDLLTTSESYGTTGSLVWIEARFEAHLDAVAADLQQKLAATRVSGLGGSPAEQRRIGNLLASLKSRARDELAREAEATQRRQGQPLSATSADELDDRLPLGRRRGFDRDLATSITATRLREEPLGLVMIDLDHFKAVNDQHGHVVGDEVLLAVARTIVRRLASKGKAYRYGGEEFVLLLPNYSSEEALGLAERVRKDIEASSVSARLLKVTASLGVASTPDDAQDARSLVEAADAALYQAKNAGRNSVCRASPKGVA